MARVESEWELVAADRNTDTTLGSGWSTRRNWTVTRFRWVRDAAGTFDSDEGTYATTLQWFNGGETDSISTPAAAIPSRTFGTTTNWCTAGDLWVTNGASTFEPCYVPFQTTNIPSQSSVNVIFACVEAGLTTFTYRWICAEMSYTEAANPPTQVDISSGLLTGATGTLSTFNYAIGSETVGSIGSIAGAYAGASTGSFSGSSTLSAESDNQGQFYCISDSQAFPDNAVDWYKQTQVWQYKEFWG